MFVKILLFLLFLLIIYILLVLVRGIFIKVEQTSKTSTKRLYDKLNTLSEKHNYVNKLNNISLLWINLERSETRKNDMETQMKKYNITNHKRVEACDGKKLDSVVGRGNLCGLEFYNERKMKKAELGCTLSHLKCIIEAENRGDEYTIICEDDIDMVSMGFWDFTMKDVINELPHDWTVLQLSNVSHPNILLKDMFGLKYTNHPQKVSIENNHKWGAAAYILNEKGRRNILEKVMKNGVVTIDDSTPYISTRKNIGIADDIIYACNKEGFYSTSIPLFLIKYNNVSNIQDIKNTWNNYSIYNYADIIYKSVKKYGNIVLK